MKQSWMDKLFGPRPAPRAEEPVPCSLRLKELQEELERFKEHPAVMHRVLMEVLWILERVADGRVLELDARYTRDTAE